MIVLLKISVPAFTVAELTSELLHIGWVTMLAIGVVATGVAGTGYLFRVVRRGIRNARALVKRVHRGLDEIEQMPQFRKDVLERLADGDERFERLDKSLDVIAGANAARVDDALAGDDRKPRVDRRRAA